MAVGSFNSRLKALQVDQTETRSQRFRIGAEDADPQTAIQQLRLTINATVSRLRATTGSEFRVESGSFVTNDQAYVIVCVCVTCLSGGASEDSLNGDNDDDDDI